MKIETTALPLVSKDLIAHMKEKLYSEKTLEAYQETYNSFYLYLSANEFSYCDKELGVLFINKHYDGVNRNYHVNLVRRINVLFEFQVNGVLNTGRFLTEPEQLRFLGDSLNCYITYQEESGLVATTIQSKSSLIRRFLLYLEGLNISSLMDIEAKDIYRHLITKKENAVSTKETFLYALRDALRFFADSGFCKKELGELFPQISTHPESSVPSCFNTDELKIILKSVDRSSGIGKRDYAVILLAAFLGIRAGDICNLRIDSIKWANERIEFIQSKTGRFLELPLLPEVKFAILDYLKEGRPKTKLDYIFIKHKAPYGPFDSSNTYCTLQKYLNEIDLKKRKHGLHSLRFSAAGNMLLCGTPITTICNVLGHTYSDTTKRYLKIDLDNLRKAALEVD